MRMPRRGETTAGQRNGNTPLLPWKFGAAHGVITRASRATFCALRDPLCATAPFRRLPPRG